MIDTPGTRLLRRQWFAFGTVFVIGMALTVLTIIYAPRKYGSHAKLLLKLGRENVSVDPTVTSTGDLVSLHRTYESQINTALNTMASREILENLVDEVGVEAILRGSIQPSSGKRGLLGQLTSIPRGWLAGMDPIDDRERAILKLQDDLVVKAAKNSSVVDVTYVTREPGMAQRVTQAWVDLYRDHHAEINSTEGSLEFFVELENELAEALDQSRTALQAAKSKFGIVTVSGEQQTLESEIRLVRGTLSEAGTSLKASEARLQSLEKQLQSTSSTIVVGKDKADSNEAQDRMRDRLYELEIEHQRIGASFNESHPKYVAASRQLQEAKDLYAQQKTQTEKVTEGVNPTYEIIEQQIALEKANIDSMNAKIVATNVELNRLSEQSKLLNLHENDVAKLQRSVDILEARYRVHVQNREQARMAGELKNRNISNVNVFQAATLERRPVSPNKKLCFVLGLIGSLMSAIGIATLREARRAGLITPEARPSSSQANTRSHRQLLGDSGELDDSQFRASDNRIGSIGPLPPLQQADIPTPDEADSPCSPSR